LSTYERKHAGLNFGASDPVTDEAAGSAIFGFWVFLMSDAVLFALLFATYGVMLRGTAGGPGPAELFSLPGAFLETLVLLVSSFTFGMASLAIKYNHTPHELHLWFGVTLLLGLVFLGLELHDFATMLLAGATPGRSGFLSAFFVLISTHGLHVLAGCIWIVVMMIQVSTIGPDRRVKINVLRLGLFWHFLDIVWVGIFSVVYLQGLIR
jgi:cytochrome o ubiquinol oxidase subunit 3